MKKTISLLLFIFHISVFAINGKTLVFFINGDWHYKGPVFEESGIRLKDQAEVIYKEILSRAKKDTKNNYVLFYDPLGKGSLFNRKWVKLKIYKKGKKLFSYGLRKPEVDTSSYNLYKEIARTVRKEIPEFSANDSLFYYYGEHFPLVGKSELDLSGGSIGLSSIKELMGVFGKFKLSIFHTCYLNNINTLDELLSLTERVLVPHKAILNTPLDFNSLNESPNFNDLEDNFLRDNFKSEKYYYLGYGSEISLVSKYIQFLTTHTDQVYFERVMKKPLSTWFYERSEESFVIETKDYLEANLPLYDYITLLDQYLTEGEAVLTKVDQLYSAHPNLEKTFYILPITKL